MEKGSNYRLDVLTLEKKAAMIDGVVDICKNGIVILRSVFGKTVESFCETNFEGRVLSRLLGRCLFV